ncbi:mediator of DNA damage checkpoint protein 1-like isoform X3 [Frieseomelitta varia]|uniref:mediator of DNA damage checkpoint protein 1-like isoform X3 n=1 Tax=Frieseomelitta varia TaxID=561572 RepID=UPI001CB68D05|nr:mediator of DNA damage checkpoint protein 1-like isoform X3 [Frieseomelitta varia]
MDIVATQVYEDYDSTPTQKVSYSTQQDNVQIGVLCIDSTTFPIKKGINQIGRHPNCCIVLDNPTVSKKHAEIEANSCETASWICDLNSSNKTKLNNSILRPNRCYELKTGDVLEFGLVRAIFKVSPPLDDSLIPDTPALNHQKTQQRVIPGTPDSSLNNSSANVSLIPATQDERKKSVFRYPTLPLRTSTTSIRKSVQNSSIDDQDNSQSFGVEKQNEQNDMGKQSKIGAPEEVTDIHDIETQHDIDFHDIETAKKINIHNFKTRDNSIRDSEKLEETGIEEEKNSTMEGRSNVNNTIIQEKKDNDSTSHCNITNKDKNKSEKLSDIENDLQKRVEIVETSEDDASDFDMSRNLLSPKDLEEFEEYIEDDSLSDELKSRSPTSIKVSCVNDDSDVNSKSIDNENIYEAATQVNKIDKNDFRVPLVDDSDDTDNEVVFQRYSRNDSQESKKSSKSQASNSDDSVTDEEGHFTEIAAKMKKAIETSLEIRYNRSKEMKNSNSSRDSEDLFNMLTQPSKKNEDLSSKCNKKLKDNEDENEVDSDSPTQVIDKKSTNMEISKNIGIEEIDDMVSTQILPMNKSSFRETSSIISIRNNKNSSEEDITEMEYNRPTQIINTEEKALYASNNNRLISSNSSVLITMEEYNTENIDYETACTQPIGDIEKQTSVPSVTDKNENKSKSTTMNFDDSVERKLKVMFENTMEEHIEDQPQISIQALENILELSQSGDESPNVNSNSTASRKAKKSKKGRKSKTAIVKTSPSSVSHKKSCNSPLSLRQHNIANSESVRNIINEESEKETEDLLISNSMPTDLSTPKSTIENPLTPKSVCKYPSTSKSPKDPSTPKSLRQKHLKESKIVKTYQEKTNTVKNDNDKLKNCVENVDDQELGTSNGEQLQQISKILISEDEDILAGLPEVRISGTLSNPPSPTMSEYRININKNRAKQISIKIAPKKRGISRKSSRKTLDYRIIENATHTINEPNSMATSENSSNSFINNLNADKISVCENYEKKVSEKSKGSMKKTKNLCSSKRSDSLPKLKSINSQEKTKQSLSIPSNRRTRNSVKENADFSSVFQVEKEVLVEKVAAEPAIENVVRKSRFRKRSLSMTDVDNSSPKKCKNINDDVSVENKNKKIINGRQSENILDFIVRKNLSNNGKMSEEANLNKEAIVKVERISLSTPTGSILNTSTESVIENDNRNRNRQNRYKNVVNSQIASSTSTKENEKTTQNVEMRRNTSRRATKKNKSPADDISSEVGEESQEVEMIMNGALKEQNANSNTETKKDTQKNARNTRMRSTRKRGNTNVYIDTDNTKTSSISSVLSESDNAYLEVPISRNKRAKVTKNSLTVTNTTVNEYIKETTGRNKRSTRSTRGQQSVTDSSVESIADQINLNNNTKTTLGVINTMVNKSTKETKKNDKQSTSSSRSQQSIMDSSVKESTETITNKTNLGNSTKNTLNVINTMINKSTKETKRNNKQSTKLSRNQQSVIDSSIIDSIEENTKNNRTDLGISKTNSLRNKRQTHTTGKAKNNKQWKKDFIEETSSSETNTSNEITSILSTPNRTRRSMSSSFAMQSPLRIKHKILFTGISSNDYNKLLTKLGASQVDNPTKCTVLVTDKVRRTVKFLCALALSVPIVSVDWLIASEKTGHFIELENYILKDSAAETKFRFKLEESLEKAKEHKLLEGYTLVVTPNVTPPPPELKNIIISCGGKALLRPPSSWPRNSIIISHEEDLTNAKKFLEKAPKTVTVHSTEFVLTGILRQELEFTEFKLI